MRAKKLKNDEFTEFFKNVSEAQEKKEIKERENKKVLATINEQNTLTLDAQYLDRSLLLSCRRPHHLNHLKNINFSAYS